MLKTVLLICLGVIALAFTLFPVFWMVLTSIRPRAIMFVMPPRWIFEPTLKHYREALFNSDIPQYLQNSLIIASCSTLIVMVLSVPAGYSLARFKSARDKFGFYILSTRMGAPIAVLIPIFVMYKSLNLLGTYYGLILIYTAMNLPLAIWMLKSFFEEVPKDFEDAALVDGCTQIGALIRIVLPCALSGVFATAILTLTFCWNEFLFGVMLTGASTRTAPVAMYQFISFHEARWGELTAAGLMIMLPVVVFTMLVSKQLVKGLTFGAIKG